MQSRDINPGKEAYGATELYSNSWALIAGVDNYLDRAIPNLRFAVADAKAMADLLPSLGFPNVRLLLNEEVTFERIRKCMDEFSRKMQPSDRLLVHFSGHGVSSETYAGRRGHLLFHDSEILGPWPTPERPYLDRSPGGSIDMKVFLADIDARIPRHKAVIVDACFSGFMAQARGLLAEQELKGCLNDHVTAVLTGGTAGERVWESEQYGHGEFTRQVLKGLRGDADPKKRGWITLSQLANFVTESVRSSSEGLQNPRLGTIGDGQGDFVFVWNRDADAAAVAVAPPLVPHDQTVRSPQAEQAWSAAKVADSYTQSPAVRRRTFDGLVYVYVPAGAFQMGCVAGDRDAGPHEGPPRQVRISRGFWIMETPVTVAAYRQRRPTFVRKPSHAGAAMTSLTWEEAADFCKRAGGRLPTEAEWEYAARGGVDGMRFPWGEHPRQFEAPLRIGVSQPNGFGLRDVCSTVWEWCEDFFDENSYRSRPAEDRDPRGPANGTLRVVRGGSYTAPPSARRLSAREGRVSRVGQGLQDVGFRGVIEERDFRGE